MTQLTIKHLGRRLPYELNGIADFLSDTIFVLDRLSINKGKGYTKFGNNVPIGCLLTEFKPILRPLSDLAKEITHKGERFVPIERLRHLNKAKMKFMGRLDIEESEKFYAEPKIA